MRIRAFLQARMSSQRFPGKVLAPFRGWPMLRWTMVSVQRALPEVPLIVLTSTEETDDPIVAYVKACGGLVVRGSLQNVFARFQDGLKEFPCDAVLRICADSPLPDVGILIKVCYEAEQRPDWDIITTSCPPMVRHGQHVELIRERLLRTVSSKELSTEEQEHVTPYFYARPDRFRILPFSVLNPHYRDMSSESSVAVDTIEDLQRLNEIYRVGGRIPRKEVLR